MWGAIIILAIVFYAYFSDKSKQRQKLMSSSNKAIKKGSLMEICESMCCHPKTAFLVFLENSYIDMLTDKELEKLITHTAIKKDLESKSRGIHPDDTTAAWFEYWIYLYLGKDIDYEKGNIIDHFTY